MTYPALPHIPLQQMRFTFKRIRFVSLRVVEFPVYAPNFITKWPTCRASTWAALFVFFAWLIKGLRYRAGFPALGRHITLADMKASHPGKPKQCLCRGEGVVTVYRIGPNMEQVKGVQFCAKMESHFMQLCRPALFGTKDGPRWLKGCAPEEMVQHR